MIHLIVTCVRSTCAILAVITILVAAVAGCAPTRTLILELRHADTLEPVTDARVRMSFRYFFRPFGPPPKFEFVTGMDGRAVATVQLHEPVFTFRLMKGDDWTCELQSETDSVEVGGAKEWSRMYCLPNSEWDGLECRFWFAGMPGEPPEEATKTVPPK